MIIVWNDALRNALSIWRALLHLLLYFVSRLASRVTGFEISLLASAFFFYYVDGGDEIAWARG